MASQRLDEWLSEAYDLELPVARSYILQGLVSLNGSPVHQAGRRIRPDRDNIQFRKPADYRNRGTAKIRTALHRLRDCGVEFAELTCLDIGASHGGFTAALLEQGVGHVYAIDVAYGIFDFDLRRRAEVTVLERKNIKSIETSWFGSDFELCSKPFVVCDVSFLSLRSVVQHLLEFMRRSGKQFQGLFLLKHQFEASERSEAGVIRDSELRFSLESEFQHFVENLGIRVVERIPSALPGRKGNQETFFWLDYSIDLDKTASSPS